MGPNKLFIKTLHPIFSKWNPTQSATGIEKKIERHIWIGVSGEGTDKAEPFEAN